jgi:DNA repair exonuclease SbcCD ATPase subunit
MTDFEEYLNPTEYQSNGVIPSNYTNVVEYLPPYEEAQTHPASHNLLTQQDGMAAISMSRPHTLIRTMRPFQTRSQQQPRDPTTEPPSSKPKKLENRIKQLKDELNTAEKERNRLSENLRRAECQSNRLEHTIANLRGDLERVRQQNAKHIQTQSRLNSELSNARAVNSSQQQKINDLEEEIQRLKTNIQIIQADNESFRADKFREEIDLSLRRGEEYYIQTFEQLRGDLEMWIARASKAGGVMPLPEDAENIALRILENLGAKGKASAEFLRANQTLRVWYRDIRARIPLVRHLAAVFLFDQIFEPSVVGLSSELRDAFSWIIDDLMSRGAFCLEFDQS